MSKKCPICRGVQWINSDDDFASLTMLLSRSWSRSCSRKSAFRWWIRRNITNQSTATSGNIQWNWQKAFSNKGIPPYADSRTFRQPTATVAWLFSMQAHQMMPLCKVLVDTLLPFPGCLAGIFFPERMLAEGAESVPSTENLETRKYKDTNIVKCCEKYYMHLYGDDCSASSHNKGVI